ncbi:hypothetical protein GGI03_004880 [Coemansia sp. RSA 2337]|nr:hypothetical protein H4S03_000132 [Coemansia sp. S3946]KAJ2053817.1 hypothetical protein H4S04_000440 [Coemansia sp. S16]KAJ2054455.1 hypothetical protein GGI08_004585 [Coemansia sp. S2]KAJ2461810.1 hypothetical protein GGI03_004880 [Coemansia sp. RSA 2337]
MKFILRASVLLALTAYVWANVAAPKVTSSVKVSSASNSRESAPAIPPAALDTHGNVQRILCQINHDRQVRRLSPVFLHQTLSRVAQQLSDQFTGSSRDSTTYNDLFNDMIAPLGSSVSSSYKILGTLRNDTDFVTQIETAIYNALFSRNLDAIGIYEDDGVYTIVLVSGLFQKPWDIQICPSNPTQFSPPNDQPTTDSVVNGIDLPKFLCAINRERVNSNSSPLVVHTALANEAEEQVKVMDQLGHYTVDGPRYVDDAIYSQHVNVVRLYWMAGEGYRNENSLVNILVSNYRKTVLDPNYTSIGVAQLNGFWSVILASQSRAPSPGTSCPITIGDIAYIS